MFRAGCCFMKKNMMKKNIRLHENALWSKPVLQTQTLKASRTKGAPTAAYQREVITSVHRLS